MLASQLLDTLPGIMRQWRLELDTGLVNDLTPGQFRIMFLIQEGHNQCGLLSRHTGASAPAMSKMVDALVRHGLIKKSTHESDRRQVTLELTEAGAGLTKKVRRGLESRLQAHLEGLSEREKQQVTVGLEILQKVFRLNMERA